MSELTYSPAIRGVEKGTGWRPIPGYMDQSPFAADDQRRPNRDLGTNQLGQLVNKRCGAGTGTGWST